MVVAVASARCGVVRCQIWFQYVVMQSSACCVVSVVGVCRVSVSEFGVVVVMCGVRCGGCRRSHW